MLFQAEVMELTKFHKHTVEKLIMEDSSFYNAIQQVEDIYESWKKMGFVKCYRIRKVEQI